MSESLGQKEDLEKYKFESGSCLIVNIDETEKKICEGCSIKKIRTGAKREVDRLQGIFCGGNWQCDEIGFGENLDKEIEGYIKDLGNKDKVKENLCGPDVFVCVLLAFGGPGYFYNREGEKKSLSTIISKFSHCVELRMKPKLFIVQTCDVNLRPVGKHLFHDEEPPVIGTRRWPKEADIMIYESNISGEYDWHPGLRKNCSGKKKFPALKCSTFIKLLSETFKKAQEAQEMIDINEIIIRTNSKLEKFIDNKMNWDLQDESWSASPRLPIVTDQFCKQLIFPPM